jgi:hypothetical protein
MLCAVESLVMVQHGKILKSIPCELPFFLGPLLQRRFIQPALQMLGLVPASHWLCVKFEVRPCPAVADVLAHSHFKLIAEIVLVCIRRQCEHDLF